MNLSTYKLTKLSYLSIMNQNHNDMPSIEVASYYFQTHEGIKVTIITSILVEARAFSD